MGNQQPVNGAGQPGMPPGGGGDPQQGRLQLPPGSYAGAYLQPPLATPPGYPGFADASQQQQKNMERTASDASMTIMDDQHLHQAMSQQHQQQQQQPAVAHENWLDDDTVPTVFRWEHGGRQVYITGTFNGWSRQIPMHRSGNDFTYIHNLKRGKHAFKFIVDDEWRFAPDQPTVADIEGRINNFIDVTDFKVTLLITRRMNALTVRRRPSLTNTFLLLFPPVILAIHWRLGVRKGTSRS
jgi:5'-AMP-activated protein kinase regulatory beta subunit